MMFLLVSLKPARSTLFPYTTLFRSPPDEGSTSSGAADDAAGGDRDEGAQRHADALRNEAPGPEASSLAALLRAQGPRSEEHTSELQSQSNIVCRLLLEKKKKDNIPR